MDSNIDFIPLPIYENCLSIVQSILKEETTYDALFDSNDSLKQISDSLKVRKKSLTKKARQVKPQNYWLLRFGEDQIEISLRVGLAETHTKETLTNILGFLPEEREYQLYVNEELICVFRKMLNGDYRTDWYQQQNQVWNGESNLPYAYAIEGGKKWEVRDFVQSVPDLDQPSLWVRFSDDEWRFVRGSGTSYKEAALLLPVDWQANGGKQAVRINEKPFYWMRFEGEIEIRSDEETRSYQSEVRAFEWTLTSEKPNWILKANMPVIKGQLKVNVYDGHNKLVVPKRYEVETRKRNSLTPWETLKPRKSLPKGCLDVKITFDGFVAHDSCFNIGDLHASFPR
ncbi:MAG: hypothetical protein AAF804_18775, partial [Bacteroidota bacterium]